MQWKYVIWAIVIILIIASYEKGIDKVKHDPIKEGMDTGVEKTKTIIDYVKDVIYGEGTGGGEESEEETEKTNLGMIPCKESSDCNLLDECNNDCTCNSETGECYK